MVISHVTHVFKFVLVKLHIIPFGPRDNTFEIVLQFRYIFTIRNGLAEPRVICKTPNNRVLDAIADIVYENQEEYWA